MKARHRGRPSSFWAVATRDRHRCTFASVATAAFHVPQPALAGGRRRRPRRFVRAELARTRLGELSPLNRKETRVAMTWRCPGHSLAGCAGAGLKPRTRPMRNALNGSRIGADGYAPKRNPPGAMPGGQGYEESPPCRAELLRWGAQTEEARRATEASRRGRATSGAPLRWAAAWQRCRHECLPLGWMSPRFHSGLVRPAFCVCRGGPR